MCSISTFNDNNFTQCCDELAIKDKFLSSIIHRHGYPPLWKRLPNFETLVHIILEQQVSLASAKASLNKLKEKISTITPENVLMLSETDLRNCYFSRQKTAYVKHLAQSIVKKHLIIDTLYTLPDEAIRIELKKIKGIGDWTADVFLMMALQRSDLFPAGDIALIKSIKEEMQLSPTTTKAAILELAAQWSPYRTIAAFILWHAYIKKRNIKI